MTGRLFSAVSAAAADRWVFRLLGHAHRFAVAVIALSGHWNMLAFSALVFVGLSAIVNRLHVYRRSPFALLASVVTCLYFVVPLVFMVVLGDNYQYGEGLAAVARTNAEYARTAPIAVAGLSVLLVALVVGLSLSASGRDPHIPRLTRSLDPRMPIVMLGLLVLALTQQGSADLIQTRVSGDATSESLWQFIFFDHAYLMVMPLIVYRRLSGPTRLIRVIALWQFTLLLMLFLLQATVGSTSKGFILTLFVLAFLMPISFLQRERSVRCLIPSKAMIWMTALLSVWVFFAAAAWRVAVFSGGATSIGALVAVLRAQATDGSLANVLSAVGYRLAAGLDRYILIVHSELQTGHSLAYSAHVATYLGKNFVNLVLPGSPFPEAYTPSSNLLPAVLTRDPLVGAASKAELLISLNTQPFTLFGVAVVLSGFYAPLLVAAFGMAMGFMYRMARGVSARLALIYLYFMAMLCYGLEVVVSNAMHAAVSLMIFIWLMRRSVTVGELVRAQLRRRARRALVNSQRRVAVPVQD